MCAPEPGPDAEVCPPEPGPGPDRPEPDTTESKRDLAAQVARPMRQFLATESGSAGLLLAATVVALVWANSPLASGYTSLWTTELSVTLGDWSISLDLRHWVDEVLMALFFFVIGLEVRREMAMGELTERRRIAVPVIAGIGGMLVPALIFLLINPSGEAADGWGIVIATDTAFVLGALALVGPRFPTQLRVFLLTLAIVDDIVAISIIGVVYAGALDPVALAVCVACLAVIALLPRLGIWQGGAYLFVGLVLVVAAIESGLHPTLAGMLAGLLVVAHPPTRGGVERANRKTRAFLQSPQPDVARTAHRSVQQALSPNERLQTMLHPLTSFVVVPLFALANAGVDLRGGILGDALSSPVTWGIVAGLVIGKTTGITAGVVATVRSGLGELPRGVGRGQMVGGAALSGIGFTVSLLIARLAFDDPVLQDQAVVGIMIAAVLAVGLGWLIFRLAAILRGETEAGLPRRLDLPVDPGRDHIRGPVDAPLTLVEYADFECPFCGKSTGMIEELREELGDQLRYVYRHLALIDVHPHSELAAEAAEAAAGQGRFWEMHDLLFEHQGELDIEDLIGYAGQLDLDVELFVTDVEQSRNTLRIQEDAASADASGAHGTPTFFIGAIRHTGAYDAATLARELRASA
ncbi:MAG: Na+/H+ antiporter NhaA [Solirubrobacterales bacterium]|nr:Na+/H+ antiporter NhaA [Solirubrobacterales bacterium]